MVCGGKGDNIRISVRLISDRCIKKCLYISRIRRQQPEPQLLALKIKTRIKAHYSCFLQWALFGTGDEFFVSIVVS